MVCTLAAAAISAMPVTCSRSALPLASSSASSTEPAANEADPTVSVPIELPGATMAPANALKLPSVPWPPSTAPPSIVAVRLASVPSTASRPCCTSISGSVVLEPVSVQVPAPVFCATSKLIAVAASKLLLPSPVKRTVSLPLPPLRMPLITEPVPRIARSAPPPSLTSPLTVPVLVKVEGEAPRKVTAGPASPVMVPALVRLVGEVSVSWNCTPALWPRMSPPAATETLSPRPSPRSSRRR